MGVGVGVGLGLVRNESAITQPCLPSAKLAKHPFALYVVVTSVNPLLGEESLVCSELIAVSVDRLYVMEGSLLPVRAQVRLTSVVESGSVKVHTADCVGRESWYI